MIEKGLPSKLWLLSKSMVEKINECRDSGETFKTKRLYLKSRVNEFRYNMGNINYGASYDYIEKEEWHWKDQVDFLKRVIKQLSGYKEALSEICRKYYVKESQADFWLTRFGQTLTNVILEGVTDEILVDHITTFIGDLDKSPIEWKAKIWVNGVWLEQNEHEIHEGLKIRRPMPSDLEFEIPFELGSMIPFHRPQEASPAILELTYRSREQKEIQDEIDIIINSLRLFRLGSVCIAKTEMYPESILSSGLYFATPGRQFANKYKYPISEGDIPKLRDFIERIKSLLPKETLPTAAGETDPVLIALQRYNDALLKPESAESQITSTVTCFEALYLKAQERMELSHRLSQRASAILRLFNFRPLEVFNDLTQAYGIRSDYIHGAQVKSEQRKNAGKLAEKVLEYARVSLFVFMQLKSLPDTDKERLINKIDNALLDEKASAELAAFIRDNCTISLSH